MGLPQPGCPLPWRGAAQGQGWFIDTALRSLPLPEETGPGGDGPDLAVLVEIPLGTALSGNRRLPGVPPARGAGQGHPRCHQRSQREATGTRRGWDSPAAAPSRPLSPPGGLGVGLSPSPGALPGPGGMQLLFPALVAAASAPPQQSRSTYATEFIWAQLKACFPSPGITPLTFPTHYLFK